MANTFKKIQTVTVGSGGSATIDFTSIPQTYTDLKLVMSLRSTRATYVDDDFYININGLSTNQTTRYLQGSGSSAASSTNTRWGALIPADGAATASVFGNAELYIPNYTSSNNKSSSIDAVHENNGTTAYQRLHANLWSQTTAITQLTIVCAAGNFVQYSTATLYGVSNANTTTGGSGKATGGNEVYTDGTYWYHVFKSDGTFTPATALNVDYLVVAGGGGVRSYQSGGGGAGGVRCTVGATGGGGSLESALAVTAQAYSITVGAGGAGATGAGTTAKGNQGSNSIFSTITSTGGGGSGSGGGADTAGTSGGSGGGSGYFNGSQPTVAAGTTNQGYAGGQGNNNTSNRLGGGGGGAGGVGGNASTSVSGAGGAGITTTISGTSTSYAGGGSGGGAVGSAGSVSAGGGTGSVSFNATQSKGSDGTTNTGGGGGGSPDYSSTASTQASGGSGIVIIRYAA